MPGLVFTTKGRLDWFRAVQAYLDGLYIGLYTVGVPPAVDTLWWQFIPANFPGYARQKVGPWFRPSLRLDGTVEIVAPLVTWACIADTALQTIPGYTLQTRAGSLVAAEQAPAVQTVLNAGDVVVVQPILTWPLP